MEDALKKIIKSAVSIDTHPIEVLVSVWSIVWGTWLILNPTTFAVTPVYHLMSVYGREETWGSLMFCIGVLKAISIMSGSIPWRKLAVSLGMTLWMIIDLSFWFTSPASTAGVTYLMPVIASIWTLIALK